MNRVIMHIDVNNAFLSWSAIDLLNQGYKYDIRDSYAVIGGDESTRSGIVLAKSMPAKKLGIYTSETLYSAKKKCPVLKVYPPNFPFYSEMSQKMFELLLKYTPDIEVASIDECYLDYTPVRNLYGDPLGFAKKIQKEIYDTLKFTVNIGIAENKLCAKMASDFSKPYKIHTLYKEEIPSKMWPLPVGDLFGIGKKTAEKLQSLGIDTIYALAHADINLLQHYFKNMAIVMINSANGIDDSRVISEVEESKGVSNEITLKSDVINKGELYEHLQFLSEKVGRRIRLNNRYASVVAVILKDKYFKRITRQRKLDNPTNNSDEIFKVTKEILNEIEDLKPVRLIGVRLDKLGDKKNYQVSLFDSVEVKENNEALDKAVDIINNKYGKSIVKKASLINVKDRKRLEKK